LARALGWVVAVVTFWFVVGVVAFAVGWCLHPLQSPRRRWWR